MKFSKMLISSALVLVGAVMLAEASGYYSSHNNNNNNLGNFNRNHLNLRAVAPVSHAYKCYGHHCNQAGSGAARSVRSYPHRVASSAAYGAGRTHQSATGPYHSYAVQPAIYGGRGLYHYRGYARYPAAHLNRKARSCAGYNCQSGPKSYRLAPVAQPVRALVLAPAYHGNHASTLPAYIPSYAPLRSSSYTRSSHYATASGARSHGKRSKNVAHGGGY